MRRAPLALVGLFIGGAAFHAVAGRGHVTPFVFPDELAYLELAKGFATLEPFRVRGEPYWFSAPLGPLVQAPAWVVESVPTAYGIAKAMNAVVMTAALFPVYWIARQVRLSAPAALLAAGASVAAPGMALHAGMLSEPLAYPLFFLALGAVLHAVTRPSGASLAVVGGLLAAAALARIQFLVLPLVYALCASAVPLLRREPLRPALRPHLPALASFGALGAVVLAVPSLVRGDYYSDLPVPTPDYTAADVLTWAARTAAYFPWGLGWLVLPGAVGGLVVLLRARAPADVAFAIGAAALAVLTYAEIGVVRAGDWHHPPVERYAIYLVPVVVIAALVYAARAAPLRRLVATLALVLAIAAWLVDFPTRPPFEFAFDSTTQTAYAFFGQWLEARSGWLAESLPPLAAGAASVGLLAVAILGSRGHGLVAASTVAFLLVTTVAYYRMDAAVTRGIERAWLVSPHDWIDRAGVGEVDYVELPGALPPLGREAEVWNRAVAGVVYLRARPAASDRFPSQRARIADDGTILVEGSPIDAGTLLLNTFGSTLAHEWQMLAEPRPGLTLVRVPAGARVRSLAAGVYFDGWSSREARFEAWPRRAAGRYRVTVALPTGHRARTVVFRAGASSRTVALRPGERATVELPATGSPVPPLTLTSSSVDLVDARRNPRRVGVRVVALGFVPVR